MYAMEMTFDLISDLHLDSWQETLDYSHRATSPYCLVAGDIAADRKLLLDSLRHLGQCYQAVFYIDGNEEHSTFWGKLPDSYRQLSQKIKKIPSVVYLQENMVIINGVAILATNGWWGFDFDAKQDVDQTIEWYKHKWQQMVDSSDQYPSSVTEADVIWMIKSAVNDAEYLKRSVTKLQKHGDVKHIIIMTHTVPFPELVSHDIHLVDNPRFSCIGNAYMQDVLDADLNKKIHTWCFGHYHLGVDRMIDGIRYVNNCRGRAGTPWSNFAYNPLRITLDT